MDRHFYPNGEDRFPALKALPYLNPVRALLVSGAICKLHVDDPDD
jgi:hypothetical protein